MLSGRDVSRREPARDGFIERPRLYRQLASPRPRPCMIRGFTGSGKTTLLRSWAAGGASDQRLVWVNLRFAIDSVPEFWSLVTEVAHRCGVLSPTAPGLLEERLDAGAEPTMAVTDLFAHIGSFTMVIDSYERLGPSVSAVDDALLQFIESVPAASVIIATRGGTKLAAEGLHIGDRVRIIDDSHLAFTEDEIDALLDANDAGTSVGSARDVLRATGGYPLAVRAVIAISSHGANILGRASLEWGSLVADELRSQLPDASTARFVALTALAPYLDVDLAIRLTGRQDAEGVLNSLAEQGFGRWIPYLGRRSLFEYVHATRQAFAHDLQHDPSASRRASATAARWLFEKRDTMAAFELAITAEDYALAARIAFELLQTYPDDQSTTHLLDQLERVPHRVLRNHPVLAFALGMARLTHPVLHATAGQAFRLALQQRVGDRILGTDADRFIAAGVRAVSLRLTGRGCTARRAGNRRARRARARRGRADPGIGCGDPALRGLLHVPGRAVSAGTDDVDPFRVARQSPRQPRPRPCLPPRCVWAAW